MDPIDALSFACSITLVIEYAMAIGKLIHQLYKNGHATFNAELQRYVTTLQEGNEQMQESPWLSPSLQISDAEWRLLKLTPYCSRITYELLLEPEMIWTTQLSSREKNFVSNLRGHSGPEPGRNDMNPFTYPTRHSVSLSRQRSVGHRWRLEYSLAVCVERFESYNTHSLIGLCTEDQKVFTRRPTRIRAIVSRVILIDSLKSLYTWSRYIVVVSDKYVSNNREAKQAEGSEHLPRLEILIRLCQALSHF